MRGGHPVRYAGSEKSRRDSPRFVRNDELGAWAAVNDDGGLILLAVSWSRRSRNYFLPALRCDPPDLLDCTFPFRVSPRRSTKADDEGSERVSTCLRHRD